MDIQVLDIRPQNSGRPLKAFVDIQYAGIVVKDLRVVKNDGRPLSVVSPQISYKDRTGQIKFKTVVTFSPELGGEISRHVLNAYAREMEIEHGNPA